MQHILPKDTKPHCWLKLSLQCPSLMIEPVVDLIGVLSGSGVEQLPEKNNASQVNGFFPLTQAEAASCSNTSKKPEQVSIVGEKLDEIFTLYGLTAGEISWELVNDEDWATSWKQFFKAFEIIPGLIIKPSWEDLAPIAGQKVIEMDPGMAFGTGQHASTSMALSLINPCFDKNKHPDKTLDIGTGTGILAIAMVLFGASKVIAIDNDPEAVSAAKKNVIQNTFENDISVSATDLRELDDRFQLIAANIVHDVLVDMAADINRLIAPAGHLVLAGILTGKQHENIIKVYRQLEIECVAQKHQDEWTALLLVKSE